MASSSAFVRLFAHLVDFGEVDPKWIYGFFNLNRPSRNWFKSYDPDEKKNQTTPAYYCFLALKDFYGEYGEPPSYEAMCDLIDGFSIKESTKARATTWLKQCEEEKLSDGEFNHSLAEIEKGYFQNRLSECAIEALDLSENDPEQAVIQLSEHMLELLRLKDSVSDSNRTQDLSEIAAARIRQIKRKEKGGVRIPYPWESFNRMTAGGMGLSEITCFAALYASGKSIITQDIACYTAENCKPDELVVCVDMEMRRNVVIDRYIARRTGIPMNKMAFGALTKAEKKVYHALLKDMRKANGGNMLFIPKGKTHNCAQIKAEIESVRRGRKVLMIKLDHFSLLRPTSKQDGNNATKEALKEFMELNEHYDSAGLLVAHLNKEEETQFQVVDQLADTIFHCKISEERPGADPTADDWYGQARQINCKLHRARSHQSGSTLYLDGLFSTASITETKPDKIVRRSGKLKGAFNRNGKRKS